MAFRPPVRINTGRHRTPGGRRLRFGVVDDDPDEPQAWVRQLVARYLHEIEQRAKTKIVRRAGVVMEPLGCGAFGCVFELEDGRVLKITSDETEGAYSRWVQQLQSRRVRTRIGPVLAVTARVDDVFRFPRRKRLYGLLTPLYGIIRERVGPAGVRLPKRLRQAVDLYTDGWDTYCTTDVLDPDQVGGRTIGVAIARLGLETVRGAGIEGRRLHQFLTYAWQRGVPIMDIHSHNLARRVQAGVGGAKVGQIVLFDYGGYDSCPTMEFTGRRRRPSPPLVDLVALEQEVPVL